MGKEDVSNVHPRFATKRINIFLRNLHSDHGNAVTLLQRDMIGVSIL